jgi:hypothetical protein
LSSLSRQSGRPISGPRDPAKWLDHFFFEYREPKFVTAALAGLIEAAAIAA